MTLAELLAKLADKRHAEGCDCERMRAMAPAAQVAWRFPNACTELARQAKEAWEKELADEERLRRKEESRG